MNQPPSQNRLLLHDPAARCWLSFSDPVEVYVVTDPAELPELLRTLEAKVEQEGFFAAGFFSYEAGKAFDKALQVLPDRDFPLAWFGIYAQPEAVAVLPQSEDHPVSPDWVPDVSEAEYDASIEHIKQKIALGETYQVNYTFRLNGRIEPDQSWPLFRQMIQAQGAHYGAWVDTPDWTICSASPELFLTMDGRRLISKPMKGTARRGLWAEHDLNTAEWLRTSEKNRAENVMIVDMVRNDMGRIAEPGSVKVSALFDIEQYPTLYQMTSTVECQTDAGYLDIFKALYPAASITGAPKASTMGIITDLEQAPRRIYTGSIGFFAPGRRMQFNVAIRTVLVDKKAASAQFGVGGGIVWDSLDAAEFAECTTKAAVLTHTSPTFDLLETLLWTPEDEYYHLLDAHLHRLARSADYFGRPYDHSELLNRLDALSESFGYSAQRVRILIDPYGQIHIESKPYPHLNISNYRVALAQSPVDSRNRFLYHKTTHRSIYTDAKAAAQPFDVDDVILWNERRELTETCIANLALEIDGELFTPPIECGLLPGTQRQALLESGRIREKILTIGDLGRASSIYLMNSVRGVWRANLILEKLLNPLPNL